MPRPIISIVGKTNSGKTTLIEKIIPELKNRDYKVGTIKHDVHKFEIDIPGKDTWRMSQAGSQTVVIASSEKMCMIKKIDKEYNIDEISEWLFNDMDIVITEGYKKENKPKIEVTNSAELLCSKDDNLLAVVVNNSDKDLKFNVLSFKMDEIKKIVDLIEEKCLK